MGRLSNAESTLLVIIFHLFIDYYKSDWLGGKLQIPNQSKMKFRNTLVILRQYSLNKLQNNAVTNVLSSMPCGTSRCRNITKAIPLEHLLQSLRRVRRPNRLLPTALSQLMWRSTIIIHRAPRISI
jgi:hypothetical protein